MPKGRHWRMGRKLIEWIATSVYFELDGDCADYFLLPGHVDNVASREDMRPPVSYTHLTLPTICSV